VNQVDVGGLQVLTEGSLHKVDVGGLQVLTEAGQHQIDVGGILVLIEARPASVTLAAHLLGRVWAACGWSASNHQGFTGYALERSLDGDTWAAIYTGTNTTDLDTTLDYSTTYYYRVAVYADKTVVGYSNICSVTTLGPGAPHWTIA
jgi:hypothetical protein